MTDRRYSLEEIQDRFAIEDLYDRQLAAAETFDFDRYDTTFSAGARVDLSDFGRQACDYAEYRTWLAGLQGTMVAAQRLTGGLRLTLEGDRATTREVVTRKALVVGLDDGGRTFGDDTPTQATGTWTHVDHPIGGAHGLLVVLHHQHRVPPIAQVGKCR